VTTVQTDQWSTRSIPCTRLDRMLQRVLRHPWSLRSPQSRCCQHRLWHAFPLTVCVRRRGHGQRHRAMMQCQRHHPEQNTLTHRHRSILFPAYPLIQSPSAFASTACPAHWPTQPFAPRPRLPIRSLLHKIIFTNKKSPSMKVARAAWCHSRVSEQPPQSRCPLTAAPLRIERSAIQLTTTI
jgi:hypothetical protein